MRKQTNYCLRNKILKTELKMAKPAAKKLKGAGSYNCAYKEESADT